MNTKEFSIDIGGKTLTATFSDLAEQANGSVMLRYGTTVVLATAVMSHSKRAEANFFPLVVDYEERFYAAGQILGNRFMRREGKASDEAILSGRIVDRSIRPLFDQYIRNEIQIIITVLSIGEDDPDVLAVIASSLAIGVSDIPWRGPVSALRISVDKDSAIIINPTYASRENISLEIFISGKGDSIGMIEAEAKEISEKEIARVLKEATNELKKLTLFQEKIIKEIGKEKRTIPREELSPNAVSYFKENVLPLMEKDIWGEAGHKKIHVVKDKWLEIVAEKFPEELLSRCGDYFDEILDEVIHRAGITENKRADGRKLNEIRPLTAIAGGISETLHGVGIFYRGGTHVLSALTLAGPDSSQIIEGIEVKTEKHFIHHYNFPPFSSGEIKRLSTGRREVGHGALVEKALRAVIPEKEIFPYTIRLVSESMASNGSTSMASICASSLALMDGGIPITRPVAGIAMGLLMKDESTYKILTDIQGPEDHHGDMDFKVAGTSEGITALQLDIKVDGIPVAILNEALLGAQEARKIILQTIEKTISAPRKELSRYAPRVIRHKIKEDKIGLLIGPGGRTIKKLTADTQVENISVDDSGTVTIVGRNGTTEKAFELVRDLTREYLPGDRFEGTVTKLFDFGAMVSLGHGTDGLVHISQIAPFRINKVSDVLKEGEKVLVVIKEVDERGRLNLSIKDIDPDFAKRKGLTSGGGGEEKKI